MPVVLPTGSVASITDLHAECLVYDQYLLTKRGSLIGGLMVEGKDGDGLTPDDFQGLSLLARSVYQDLPATLIVTQYYAHFAGMPIQLKARAHPIAHLLSTRRAAFLNQRTLSSSALFFFFELLPAEALSALSPWALLAHCGKSLYSAASRVALKVALSSQQSLVCHMEELERQRALLRDTLGTVVGKWANMFAPTLMSLDDLWRHTKFVANLDPYYLSPDYQGQTPLSHWDLSLADGDRQLMEVQHTDVVKCCGATPRYVRIGAVNQFGEDRPKWGMWAEGKKAPVCQTGNYLLMMRYQPLTVLQRSLLFRNKERELNRKNFNLIESIKGHTLTEAERRDAMKPAIREALREIEEAEMVPDHWGRAHGYFAAWTTDPLTMGHQSLALRRAMDGAGFQSCWETVGLARAFKTLMVAGRPFSLRDVPLTTTQMGAASLLYRSGQGQPVVRDLGNEECQYVFVGDDHTAFHYSPFVEGSGLVIGIGPIRTGKSFTKNTLACHFLKYGGLLQGIDVDIGMRPVAQLFGEDGAVFSMESESAAGFNTFAVCTGSGDTDFIHHLKSQIMLMVQANDTPAMQVLSVEEQTRLDEAIAATIALDNPDLRRLRTVVLHCPDSLQMKLQRWIHTEAHTGMYAKYFDAQQDAIGRIDRPMTAFNLRAIKDNPVVLPLVMAEIFFRVTRLFEHPDYRHVPKYLDIDEAHMLLSIPYVASKIVQSIRTWGKYLAGMGLWSQSPLEFAALPHWGALRSAASTFFFMADHAMDIHLYKTTFHLTDGECEAIQSLQPKREAFIVQRKLGIAKTVNLSVEPEQYVVSTSTPRETALREKHVRALGFERGIDQTIEDLGLTVAAPSHVGVR